MLYETLIVEVAQLINQNKDQPVEVVARKVVAMHLDRLTRTNLEARVIDLARQKMTRAEIADKTGYSLSGVYQILKRNGLTYQRRIPRKPLTARELSIVVGMLKAGLSVKAAAECVSYARGSLYRIPEVAALVRMRS